MNVNKILIVDDSTTITSILKHRLELFNFDIVVANNFIDAAHIVESGERFFMAILDLILPDAPNGEIVDYMLSKNIPAVVMTGNYRDEQRAEFSKKTIIDYVLKDSPWSLEYIVSLTKRIYDNQNTTVLVVDDSNTIRKTYRKLLEIQNYKVVEAENGKVALDVLRELHNEVKLILTDYNMPVMDGFELITRIRAIYSKEDMFIIGLSAESDRSISAKFLKLGANDFLSKSFIKEEFYARVSQNIDSLNLIIRLKNIAMRDHLTGLYNRHYFFSSAEKQLKIAKDSNDKAFLAMIDIDYFKSVNDTYGHQVGDEVLVSFSNQLKSIVGRQLPGSIIARFGGEEFVIMYFDNNPKIDFIDVLENLRTEVETSPVKYGELEVSFTISIGVSLANRDLDKMIKVADDSLYVAKENGRNMLVLS